MRGPVLGVLGGMGPLATAYFMGLTIEKTASSCDQGNMPMIIWNDPQIPDRTAYILGKSTANPVSEMIAGAHWLEQAGVSYIAIPCNTAHYFYNQIVDSVSIPVLNIMQETAKYVANCVNSKSKIGLLATEGTITSRVFQDCFEQYDLCCTSPSILTQKELNTYIYKYIKSGKEFDYGRIVDISTSLHDEGCDAVVVGCTELSVACQRLGTRPPWLIDSLEVLAERCVELYVEGRDNLDVNP